MKLSIVCAHYGADSLEQAVKSWNYPPFIFDGTHGMLQAYQFGFEALKNSDILAFLHDDLIIHEKDWLQRVLREFEDPQVGLVGFGGALGHGSPELYKVPYHYHQLGRSNFLSNMVDAEAHGKRFTGSTDVAVLDGFALIVRREVLEQAKTITIAQGMEIKRTVEYLGAYEINPRVFDYDPSTNSAQAIQVGWPLNTPIGYVCYDYWLSCMTRRLGYRIRLVGVACQHLGGRTYVKLGLGDKPDHWEKYLAAHRYIYDEFKDCLPYEVTT